MTKKEINIGDNLKKETVEYILKAISNTPASIIYR